MGRHEFIPEYCLRVATWKDITTECGLRKSHTLKLLGAVKWKTHVTFTKTDWLTASIWITQLALYLYPLTYCKTTYCMHPHTQYHENSLFWEPTTVHTMPLWLAYSTHQRTSWPRRSQKSSTDRSFCCVTNTRAYTILLCSCLPTSPQHNRREKVHHWTRGTVCQWDSLATLQVTHAVMARILSTTNTT